LWLNPAWNLSFRQFVAEVRRKMSLASKHALYAFDIVAGEIFAADRNALSAALSFGYVARQSTGAGSAEFTYEGEADNFSTLVGSGLTLSVLRGTQGLGLNFVYDSSAFNHAGVESMSAHFISILQQVGNNVNRQLQEISFEGEHNHSNPSETLAAEGFHF
jgi:hypothetical protein